MYISLILHIMFYSHKENIILFVASLHFKDKNDVTIKSFEHS